VEVKISDLNSTFDRLQPGEQGEPILGEVILFYRIEGLQQYDYD